ncbi:hypothetical protein [Streptomyces sp. NPDC001568]|uniref:hypothetical protein n=1 Tax=Streptomyces sp. NPDC001568 TaxID=3364588 RepID=UPI0036AFEDAE
MGSTGRTLCAGVAGMLLAALALAPPAHADPGATDGAAPDTAATCRPALRVLESLPGSGEGNPRPRTDQVNGIGPLGLSVGVSHDKPAYWLGTAVRAVPLPAGATGGSVEAVNRLGLMVGTLTGPGGRKAFSYRPGTRAVTLLPGGQYATAVNDRGHVVGHRHDPSTGAGTGLEWSGPALRRELTVPRGFRLEEVTGINNAGQITGHGSGPTGNDEEPYDMNPGLLWSAEAAAAPVLLQPVGGDYEYYRPQAIDESGRIVGHHWYTRAMRETPLQWTAPYTEPSHVPLPAGSTSGTFEDISPRTGVSVGAATTYNPPEDTVVRAQYWTGGGPMRILPGLTPTGHSAAHAVGDDDRVGGVALDAGNVARPVVWTCAGRQAYEPVAATRPAARG